MRVSTRILIAALFLGGISSANLFAQAPERLLIPFYTEAPIEGAHGSVWTTELTMHVQGTTPVSISGYDSGCRFSCTGAAATPGITFAPSLFETQLQGAYLTVFPPDRSHDLDVQLRARDLSRQADDWGAEVPTIFESEAPRGGFQILDVPNDDRYRVMLRLYHFGIDQPVSATIRVFVIRPDLRNTTSAPPDELVAVLEVPMTRGALWIPGYGEIGNMFSSALPDVSAERVRIEVEVGPDLPIWGLVTVTNNTTQHATVISPSE